MPTKKQIGIVTTLSAGALIAAYFIAPFEGETFKAYKDGANVWTDCKGHTLNVHEGDVATKAQCDEFYKEDIVRAETSYNDFITNQNIPANVQAATISLIFNTGAKAFKTSTLAKKLNAGDIVGACNEFPRWHFVNGKNCELLSNNCSGIVKRRLQEKELCLDKNTYDSYSLNSDNAFSGVRIAQSGTKSR